MGTTGTQASFMEIFHGDGDKIDRLNEILCEKAGFPSTYSVSTQTYTRKVDLNVAQALAGVGATAQRICTDIRHLANLKEIEEYVYPILILRESCLILGLGPMHSQSMRINNTC